MTGRKALLVDYFKPLKGFDLYKNQIYLNHLIDVQIESILLDNGPDDLTPPGMRSIKEYFSIFDDNARRQRRKMTVSVIKKLKKHYLKSASFQTLGQNKKKEYLAKIKAHFNLCEKDKCLEARKLSAAYFLSAIQHYCNHNPVKLEIIRFLISKEIKAFEAPNLKGNKSISALFTDEKTDGFSFFRSLTLQILFSSDPIPHIQHFINKTPVTYDPVIDLFVAQGS